MVVKFFYRVHCQLVRLFGRGIEDVANCSENKYFINKKLEI
jgi:hypothetical protein